MLIIGGHRDSLSSLITHCPFGRANFVWWWRTEKLTFIYLRHCANPGGRAELSEIDICTNHVRS